MATSGAGQRPGELQQLLQGLHVERLGGPQDEVLHAGAEQIVDLTEEIRADRAGALDGLRVAPDLLAPVGQDLVLALPVVHRRERVPHVRVLRGELERHLLAPAPDHDGHAADRRRHQLREPRLDPRQRRAEIAQAGRRGSELEPVLLVVALEPAGADAEDGAAAAHVVHGGDVAGQQLGIPVAVRVHERAEPGVPRLGRDRRQERHAGEVVAVRRPVEGEHVVPDPERVDAERVRRPVGLANLLDRAVLGMDLVADPESHVPTLPSLTPARRAEGETAGGQ